jgi:hypothetical protein
VTHSALGTPHSTVDPQQLTDCYELLRLTALDRRQASPLTSGRMVLIRQGMVAWAHLCAVELANTSSIFIAQPAEPRATLPAPIRSDLTAILTNLVVGTHGQRERA